MAEPNVPRPHEAPNTGAETVPPGATRKAHERDITPPHGPNEDAIEERTIDDPRPPKAKRRAGP
jgi:hypothetical protein